MPALMAILREAHDPRDFDARHDCAFRLLVASMVTLCGARSCVDYADFAASNEVDLAEI